MPIKLYNKENILHSCRNIFAHQGYDAASTQSLAEAAGISKALIFHHFGSKKELYFTILEDCLTRYNEQIDTSKITADNFFDALSEYVKMKLAYCEKYADEYAFIKLAFHMGSKRLRAEVNERFTKITPSEIPILHELFDKVKLRFMVNKEDAYSLIFMAIDGFEQRFIEGLTGNKKTDNEHYESFLKQINSCMNMIQYGIE